jgi:hypothetical protein
MQKMNKNSSQLTHNDQNETHLITRILNLMNIYFKPMLQQNLFAKFVNKV